MVNTGLTALLFSGGIDSVALAHWKRPDVLLTINYGQTTASAEIRTARYFARELNLPLDVVETDLRCIGSGSLAKMPACAEGVHPEWWPFRNQLLVSIGAAWASIHGVSRLLIGTVKSDECFADGRMEFLNAMNALLAVQEGAIQIEAPAIEMEGLDLVKVSKMAHRYLPMCFSCNVSVKPCGNCRSCIKFGQILDSLCGTGQYDKTS